MAINERVITGTQAAAVVDLQQSLILHLDANDDDSYDGDGSIWWDISEHDVTIPLSDNADDLELHLNASDSTSYGGSGTTWTDISGNNNNGTISGATFDIDNGGFFTFDGTNDIVKNASLGNSFRGQTTLSIEAWFNTSASGRFTIASFSNTADASTDLWLGFNSGENTVGFRNVNDGTNNLQFDDSGGSSVRDGNWHHVVFTADSGGTHLYVDGSELTGFSYTFGSSSTTIVMPNDLNQFAIGGNTDSGGDQWFMNGKIGAVRIYSKALSASEVGQNYRHGRDYIYTELEGTPVFDLDLSTSTPSDVTVSNATYDEELGNFWQFIKSQNNNKLRLTKDAALTNRTIEMWCRADTLTGGYLMGATPDRGYGSDSFGNWNIYMTATIIVFISSKFNNSTYGGYVGNHSLSAGEWFHVAMICGGTTTRGFINGIEITETSSASYNKSQSVLGTNVDEIHLGFDRPGSTNTTLGWDGQIGQVRIYNSMLTQDQIMQNYVFTKNDYPNGYNSTISNTTWNSSGYFDFNGSSSYIDTNFQMPSTTEFSFSCWFNKDNSSANYHLIGDFDSSATLSTARFRVQLNSADAISVGVGNGTSMDFSVFTPSVSLNNIWRHIVVTVNGTSVKAYIDGSQVGTTDTSLYSLASGVNDFAIGAYHIASGKQNFDGQISKVKIYDKTLTQAEITALYNEGE